MRINLAFDRVGEPNLIHTKTKAWAQHPGSHFHIQRKVPLTKIQYDEIPTSEAVAGQFTWFYPVVCFGVSPETWMRRPDYVEGWQPQDFLDGISEEACRGIRDGNGWLLFLNATEAMRVYNKFDGNTVFDYMHAALDHFDIPPEKVIYEAGNLILPEEYERWCDANGVERRMEMISFEFFESAVSRRMHILSKRFVKLDTIDRRQRILRERKFLSFNRAPHAHRVLMLSNLFDAGFFDEGYVSFPGEITRHQFQDRVDGLHTYWISKMAGGGYPLAGNHRTTKEFATHPAWSVDRPPGMLAHQDITWELDAWPYMQSYLHIVAETRVEPSMLFLTEKIFKPIANYQPFIVVGSQHTLRHLRSIGYKTFDINEGYDEEPHPVRRLHMALAEARRILSMPIADLHDWYWNQRDILVENRNILHGRVVEKAHRLPRLMAQKMGLEFDAIPR